MKSRTLDEKTEKLLLNSQKNEITEHIIYEKLAQSTKDSKNRKILQLISDDELRHYNFWKQHTNKDTKPDKLKDGCTY
jgi:rubrerythrin